MAYEIQEVEISGCVARRAVRGTGGQNEEALRGTKKGRQGELL